MKLKFVPLSLNDVSCENGTFYIHTQAPIQQEKEQTMFTILVLLLLSLLLLHLSSKQVQMKESEKVPQKTRTKKTSNST